MSDDVRSPFSNLLRVATSHLALAVLMGAGCGAPGVAPTSSSGVHAVPATHSSPAAAHAPVNMGLAASDTQAAASETAGETVDEQARLAAALVGKPAPDFTYRPVHGEPFRLSSLRGKVVVLEFWATWCPDCVRAAPRLAAVHAGVPARDVVFLGISTDKKKTPEEVLEVAHQLGGEYLQMVDGPGREVSKLYDSKWIPTILLIDARGVIQGAWLDLDGDEPRQLAGAIEGLLAGRHH